VYLSPDHMLEVSSELPDAKRLVIDCIRIRPDWGRGVIDKFWWQFRRSLQVWVV
jgi:hypothetical protein